MEQTHTDALPDASIKLQWPICMWAEGKCGMGTSRDSPHFDVRGFEPATSQSQAHLLQLICHHSPLCDLKKKFFIMHTLLNMAIYKSVFIYRK